LRFGIVDDKISFTYFRTPPKWDFRCNYSLGGKIELIHSEKIPKFILDKVGEIMSKLNNMWSIYSIDITVDESRVILVELNSSPGLSFNKEDVEFQKQFFIDIIRMLQIH
jgi:glutathione synthase/RimK-type ligase-like ATP-grasp enzyme